jgi:ribosome-associated heat shock protein Hsp15
MTPASSDADGLRLDRWLWQARFFKTRALAAQLAAKRRIRINRLLVTKPHFRRRTGTAVSRAAAARGSSSQTA